MVSGLFSRKRAGFSQQTPIQPQGGGALGTPLAVGGGVPDAPQGTAEKFLSSS